MSDKKRYRKQKHKHSGRIMTASMRQKVDDERPPLPNPITVQNLDDDMIRAEHVEPVIMPMILSGGTDEEEKNEKLRWERLMTDKLEIFLG